MEDFGLCFSDFIPTDFLDSDTPEVIGIIIEAFTIFLTSISIEILEVIMDFIFNLGFGIKS
jgi:hypothetical protein